MAIIIVIAILTMIVSYFYMDEDKPDVLLVPSTKQQEKQDSAFQLAGTWVSHYDGAMLTLTSRSFTLEISGVDAGSKVRGTLAVEGNIVTFVNASDADECIGLEGHYLFSIDEKGEVFFKLIKDPCESRKERMTAGWFSM